MNFVTLRLLLKIGHKLSITPSSTEVAPLTIREKFWALFMVLFYVVGVFTSCVFRTTYYANYIHLKLAIKAIVDGALFIFNICTVVFSVTRRPQWYFLIRHLKLTPGSEKLGQRTPLVKFFTLNLIFWAIMIYMTFTFTRRNPWKFYRQYAIEYLQLYVLFFVNYLTCAVLAMLKARYNHVNGVLAGTKPPLFHRVKYDVIMLKQAVDYFNDIFGWPLLLTLIFASLQTLSYLDSFFKVSVKSDPVIVTSNVLMMLMLVLGIVAPVWMCDSVIQEAENILSSTYRRFLKEKEKEDFCRLIEVVKDNFPKFSTARFAYVERGTLFKIFETVSTVLIIMIQFNPGASGAHSDNCSSSCPCNATSEQ